MPIKGSPESTIVRTVKDWNSLVDIQIDWDVYSTRCKIMGKKWIKRINILIKNMYHVVLNALNLDI